MQKPSVLIVGADAHTEEDLRQLLRDAATVVGALPTFDRVGEEFREIRAQVVLVPVSLHSGEPVYRAIAELTSEGARVVALSPTKDSDLILRTMRAGAREFVVDSDRGELLRALSVQARGADEVSGAGSVLTVFPTRGGVGTTTVAVNLAGALQRRGERVCLVDFDLYLGDVLSFLDLPGVYSITDVIANMRRLDRDLLDSSIVRHPSGLRVLAQSGKVEEAESVRPTDVVGLLDFLRRHFDRLIVDGTRGFDDLSLAVLDASQQIVMVLTQDVPAVRSTKRCLELFRRVGYDERKIKLVLNRYQKASKITPDVIAETVGLDVVHTVSNDFASSIDAINRGLLLADVAPRSKLTKDIEALAPIVAGAPRDDGRRRGFLRLFSRRTVNGPA
jgi:pilus assembly protein CpaE